MDDTKPHLIYFADAMCSWCWGFAPSIAAIEERFGPELPIRLIVGGLRPGTTEPMTDTAKTQIRNHWDHVHDASGQPFDFTFFEQDGFVYDSHPAAKAVVTVRSLKPESTLPFFLCVQRAFYAERRDVTRIGTLADLAQAQGIDADRFQSHFDLAETERETWTDYTIARQTGVTGFPTMIAGSGVENRYALIAKGYQQPANVLAIIAAWRTQSGLDS